MTSFELHNWRPITAAQMVDLISSPQGDDFEAPSVQAAVHKLDKGPEGSACWATVFYKPMRDVGRRPACMILTSVDEESDLHTCFRWVGAEEPEQVAEELALPTWALQKLHDIYIRSDHPAAMRTSTREAVVKLREALGLSTDWTAQGWV